MRERSARTAEATAPILPTSPVESGRDVVDFRAYVYVALMVVFGSTTAAAAKIAVAELPVTLVPAVRFGMAGLCLLPWVLGRGVLLRMVREDALLASRHGRALRTDQPGFFSERGPVGADLACRHLLRDLSPGGPAPGLDDENGASGP